MEETVADKPLRRELKNRHIQLIALGGAVGTGLFLGISQTIREAGPSVILGYTIAGVVAFFIMRQLAEMVVEEPVAGSFSFFASKYWSDFAGFVSGWNYWVLWVLVGMAELSAVGVYARYWWPALPNWITAAVCFMAINALNLLHVSLFGEIEFWFAIVKVGAILAMIAFGGYLLVSGHAGPDAGLSNLWLHGGFFPHGTTGLVVAMAAIMFSFGGIELVGVTAAEAENPAASIPKATNQVVYRILIFYIGALVILLSLFPWDRLADGGSPFVMTFRSLNKAGVASALNIVIVTAALSVYNSSVYSNSRMLLGLASRGSAPAALKQVNRRGVPVAGILVSAVATAMSVAVNYVAPEKAFGILMDLVVAALVINWMMISTIHIRFRLVTGDNNRMFKFPSVGYPITNFLCLGFLVALLGVMYRSPDARMSVLMIPAWLAFLGILYAVRRHINRPAAAERLSGNVSS